jgi:hypothetical protein
MEKHHYKALQYVGMWTTLIYFLFSLIEWNTNPTQWHMFLEQNNRIGFGLGIIVVWAICWFVSLELHK